MNLRSVRPHRYVNRRLVCTAAVAIAFLTAPQLTQEVQASPEFGGDWITPDGATVRIGPCGTNTCGRIIHFIPPPGETVASARDLNNKDTSKRNRKILGLAILYRLQPAGDGLKGRVYDPRRGFSANATVTRTSRDRLTVKGCVRVIFEMCEKEIWRKAR